MDSILTSIKKLLGITEDYTHFDSEIVMYINSSISTLTQLGVGPEEGFLIRDNTATWIEFIGERLDAEFIKTCIYLKVRLIFDPPQNGFLVEAMTKQIAELEWRLNLQHDKGGIT